MANTIKEVMKKSSVQTVLDAANSAIEQLETNDQQVQNAINNLITNDNQVQSAINEALVSSVVDINFVSYDVGVLPSTIGATTGTIGAYFTTENTFQKLRFTGSVWEEIGEPISTKSYVDNKLSRISISSIEDLRQIKINSLKGREVVYVISYYGDGLVGGGEFYALKLQAKANGTANIGNGVSLIVDALPEDLLTGQKLEFDGGGIFTLTADVSKGSTTIVGNLSKANIANDEEAGLLDDNGSVIKPTYAEFSGAFRWKRPRVNGISHVSWFGAKGDGVSIDTERIRAAVNFAGEFGTVHFGEGKTYLNFGEIEILNSQTILGHGSTLKRAPQSTSTLSSNATAGDTQVLVTNPGNFTIGETVLIAEGTRSEAARKQRTFLTIIDIVGSALVFDEDLDYNFLSGDLIFSAYPQINGYKDGIENVEIIKLFFDGNKANNTTFNWWESFIECWVVADNFKITECKFTNSVVEGLICHGENCEISHNIFL